MEKIIIAIFGSKNTTIAGFITAIAMIVLEAMKLFDGNPETVMNESIIVAALGVLGISSLAKDGSKTSKQLKLE